MEQKTTYMELPYKILGYFCEIVCVTTIKKRLWGSPIIKTNC